MLRRSLKKVTTSLSRPVAGPKMLMSSTAEASSTKAETYSVPVQFFHWTMGIFICTATGKSMNLTLTESVLFPVTAAVNNVLSTVC